MVSNFPKSVGELREIAKGIKSLQEEVVTMRNLFNAKCNDLVCDELSEDSVLALAVHIVSDINDIPMDVIAEKVLKYAPRNKVEELINGWINMIVQQ